MADRDDQERTQNSDQHQDQDDSCSAGVSGQPVQCSTCTAPVVCYLDKSAGYRLVCGCPNTAVELSTDTMDSSLFEPVSGRWSQIDDPDFDWWDGRKHRW